MTYARSRLMLGIFGVGLVVMASCFLLITQLPLKLLPTSREWTANDLWALAALLGCLNVAMVPLDLLGGFLLPNRRRSQTITLRHFLVSLLRGAAVQGTLFFAISVLILSIGRLLGLPGVLVVIVFVAAALVALQLPIAKLTAALPTCGIAGTPTVNSLPSGSRESDFRNSATRNEADANLETADKIANALKLVSQWGWELHPVVALQHQDTGFTGGVAGFPRMETVVLPAGSVARLSREELAITIARRFEAIESGSRTRGLLLAVSWVTAGFAFSTMLPGGGVSSVGELAMTCLGFTLWTFLGLLTLPTLSRQASYAIDEGVLKSGASPGDLQGALKTFDTLQDDEPKRPAFIEAIFHPVPSVENRKLVSPRVTPIAWHAARITLFLSWACMGMLVRAVHCNVGRPELWVMLPTD